jgi:heme A synthase
VVLQQDTLAIVHGCLAQAFFVLLVTIAFLASRARRVPGAAGIDSALRGLSVVAVALLYLQIVFGALLTHAGRIDLHLAGAVLAFALVPIVTARARRSGDTIAGSTSRVLLALLGLQLLLGIGSYLARFTSMALPGEQLTVLALPVTHRLVGSLLLAAATVLALRVHAAPATAAPVTAPRVAAAGDFAAAGDTPLAPVGRHPLP